MTVVDIVTLGCKVNRAESGALAQRLAAGGLAVHHGLSGAGLIVLNTCAVTGAAAAESRKLLRRALRRNPQARAVVTGCLGALERQALLAIPGVLAVFGPAEAQAAADCLLADGARPAHGTTTGPAAGVAAGVGEGALPASLFRARPELKVQDGCDSACAYCAIPAARGPSRSTPLPAVVAAARRIAALGFGELVLAGIHLGRWGHDLSPPGDLAGLLDAVLEATAAAPAGLPLRLRLSSLEPNELAPALLARFSAWGERLCPHLHVPLQSGADSVLRRMGRPYTAERFAAAIAAARAALPGLTLGLDVLCGHPGEDQAAFAQTLALLEALRPSYLHAFPFSPRPGTRAAAMPDRPAGPEVAARMARLLALDRRLRAAHAAAQVGTRTVLALERVDAGGARGMCASGLQARLSWPQQPPAPPRVGQLLPARVVGQEGGELLAIALSP